MSTASENPLADFGTRSLVTHVIMAATFLSAVVTGLFVQGTIGLVSFVAFVNFTSGMWICQTIHSIGGSTRDEEYEGVLKELRKHVR